MRVADLRDPLANELRDVDVDLRRDLARNDHEARRNQRLARAARGGISRQHGVEDAVRDLVGDLVRMAFGDRLGREEELPHPRESTYLMRRKNETCSSCVCEAAYSTAERSGFTFWAISAGMCCPASFSMYG